MSTKIERAPITTPAEPAQVLDRQSAKKRSMCRRLNRRSSSILVLFRKMQYQFFTIKSLRSLEVRGTVVEMIEEGVMEHLDHLCELYTGRSPYFGTCVPAAFHEREKPVGCKILPTRVVTLDAIYK